MKPFLLPALAVATFGMLAACDDRPDRDVPPPTPTTTAPVTPPQAAPQEPAATPAPGLDSTTPPAANPNPDAPSNM